MAPSSTVWWPPTVHRLDRGGSPSGQGTVPGGRGSGRHWLAAALVYNGYRLEQRQCLHQRDADTVVCGTRHRVHPSRAHHKNDLAWTDENNGALARRLVGNDRYSGCLDGRWSTFTGRCGHRCTTSSLLSSCWWRLGMEPGSSSNTVRRARPVTGSRG